MQSQNFDKVKTSTKSKLRQIAFRRSLAMLVDRPMAANVTGLLAKRWRLVRSLHALIPRCEQRGFYVLCAMSGTCSSRATCASFVSRRVRCRATHTAARRDDYGCRGYPSRSHPVWAATREPRGAHSACRMLMALRALSSWCRDRLSELLRLDRRRLIGSSAALRRWSIMLCAVLHLPLQWHVDCSPCGRRC